MDAQGPLLSLALRSRRWLLLFATALGLAAAGGTVRVAAERGAQHAFIAATEPGFDCEFWGGCSDSWWSWPGSDAPPSPPTAVVGPMRRWTDPA